MIIFSKSKISDFVEGMAHGVSLEGMYNNKKEQNG